MRGHRKALWGAVNVLESAIEAQSIYQKEKLPCSSRGLAVPLWLTTLRGKTPDVAFSVSPCNVFSKTTMWHPPITPPPTPAVSCFHLLAV